MDKKKLFRYKVITKGFTYIGMRISVGETIESRTELNYPSHLELLGTADIKTEKVVSNKDNSNKNVPADTTISNENADLIASYEERLEAIKVRLDNPKTTIKVKQQLTLESEQIQLEIAKLQGGK